jgi:type IV pilus assembly protein PilO
MNLAEFNSLDFSNAGSWPPLAKTLATVVVVAAVAGLGYWFHTRHQLEALENVRRIEQQLRQEFVEKQQVMANLDAYRAQLEEMQNTLNDMLRQLPTRTEMPDLLEDISNTGKRNGLNFELFKPEPEQPHDFYAAKPISIRAHSTYHQFGAFVSNIAALPRIVTLENATLNDPQGQTREGQSIGKEESKPLLIEATLQTYRYLDEDPEAAKGAPGTGERDSREARSTR